MRPSRDFLNSSVFCFQSSAFKQELKQMQSKLKIWLSLLPIIIFQIILPWNYLTLGFLLVLTLGPAADVYSFSLRPRPQTQRNAGVHRAASIQQAGVAPPFPSEGRRSDRRRATRNARTTDRSRGGASHANASGRAAPPHAREPEARGKPGGAAQRGAALPPPLPSPPPRCEPRQAPVAARDVTTQEASTLRLIGA